MPPGDYDDEITIFSPEGRLYQVEYALELVKRGAPIVGVSSTEGVVLAANETPESSLEDPNLFRKIFQLDDHIGTAIAGLSSDARVLIDLGRLLCQHHRLLYGEPMDIMSLTMRICDLAHVYTQYAWVRPFGVCMIVSGVDRTGCRVFTTDPAGSYRGYRATAEGRNSDEANGLLVDRYRKGITLDEAIGLAVEGVKTASEVRVTAKVVKVAVIPAKNQIFRRLTEKEVEKYLI